MMVAKRTKSAVPVRSLSKSVPKEATQGKTKGASKSKVKATTASRTTKARKPARAKTVQQRQLHLISDYTGNLANHVVSTVMSQFGDLDVQRRVHRFCDSLDKIDQAMSDVHAKRGDVVLHAVIGSSAKQRIESAAAKKSVPCFDLTGPVSQFLGAALNVEVSDDPDPIHKTDEGYFHRIDAMEFTLQHDDNRRMESLHEADVVLLGISRVSKSPTSTFLGSLGYKAANVAIAPSLGLPKELNRCKGKVVALTMQPSKLFEIRQRRFRLNKFAAAFAERDETIDYLQLRDVSQEVMAAEQLYRKAKFPIVDVTGMTIEEAATHVLEELGLLEPS